MVSVEANKINIEPYNPPAIYNPTIFVLIISLAIISLGNYTVYKLQNCRNQGTATNMQVY